MPWHMKGESYVSCIALLHISTGKTCFFKWRGLVQKDLGMVNLQLTCLYSISYCISFSKEDSAVEVFDIHAHVSFLINSYLICLASTLLQEKADAMVTHLARLAEKRLIISFAPYTPYYSVLKRIGELFPGPSKVIPFKEH